MVLFEMCGRQLADQHGLFLFVLECSLFQPDGVGMDQQLFASLAGAYPFCS